MVIDEFLSEGFHFFANNFGRCLGQGCSECEQTACLVEEDSMSHNLRPQNSKVDYSKWNNLLFDLSPWPRDRYF